MSHEASIGGLGESTLLLVSGSTSHILGAVGMERVPGHGQIEIKGESLSHGRGKLRTDDWIAGWRSVARSIGQGEQVKMEVGR